MYLKSYEELKVWQKSIDLVEETYMQVKKLPVEERYELSSQMRRAAVSIPSNIAEGHARSSTKEFVNFLSIAKGSNAELHTQFVICVRLGYLSDGDVKCVLGLLSEVGRMLSGMMASLDK